MARNFGALDISPVSDALDRLGIAGQCIGIRPLDRRFRLIGRAFTVRYVPVGVSRGTVGDFVDDLEPGQVPVLDNAGRVDATVWGDLLTVTAHRMGLAGTVIDGICRDIDRSLEVGYPIFSRGYWMRTGKDRVQADAYQVPVNIGGVRVEPGDLMVGGADGLLSVPASRAAEVLEVAREIAAHEERIRAVVAAGGRLDEARKSAGYHDLQHRR
ncbi:MAG: RraA family protein [Actinobacteria bacterium]|nr:RraA family protein [Actinomycetota bacterium]